MILIDWFWFFFGFVIGFIFVMALLVARALIVGGE